MNNTPLKITNGTMPTTPNPGDIWEDNTPPNTTGSGENSADMGNNKFLSCLCGKHKKGSTCPVYLKNNPTESENQSTHWEKQGRCPHCGCKNGHGFPPLSGEKKCECVPVGKDIVDTAFCPIHHPKDHTHYADARTPEEKERDSKVKVTMTTSTITDDLLVVSASGTKLYPPLSHKTWEEEMNELLIVRILSLKDPIYGSENQNAINSLKDFISSLIAEAERKVLDEVANYTKLVCSADKLYFDILDDIPKENRKQVVEMLALKMIALSLQNTKE